VGLYRAIYQRVKTILSFRRKRRKTKGDLAETGERKEEQRRLKIQPTI
jgi:hypothetical protein